MTPAARVQAAIEVLDHWRGGAEGLDRVLSAWGRAHRFAGSGDRRAIADLVYDAVRRMRSAAWVAGASEEPSARDLIRGSLILDGADPGEVFTGARHAPAQIGPGEQGSRVLDTAPEAVRADLPDWLWPMLEGAGAGTLEALRARAPVDLRVNSVKGDRVAALAALREDGISGVPLDLSPMAVRLTDGARRVAGSRAFLEGLVEVQDAASQAVADLAEARPGETVLDLCAGGGGKTLALAAAMQGQGRLIAHDIAPGRMVDLPGRAARAGVKVDLAATSALAALTGRCDLVFVDAPCSGSGAWRRNPDAKWTLSPARLEELTEVQTGLLEQAAELCAPDGRIAYATCSLISRENEDRVAEFLSDRRDWHQTASLTVRPPAGDGFFASVVRKIGVKRES